MIMMLLLSNDRDDAYDVGDDNSGGNYVDHDDW